MALRALALAVGMSLGLGCTGAEPRTADDVGSAAAAASRASGRVQLRGASVDLGPVPPGTDLEHVFELGNRGLGVLRLGAPLGCCGCTAQVEGEPELARGEVRTVRVRCRTPDGRGPFERTIYVDTSDPHAERVALTLRGKLTPFVTWTAPTAQLARAVVGEPLALHVELRALPGADVERASVRRTELPAGWLAQVDAGDPGAGTLGTLTVRTSRPLRPGRFALHVPLEVTLTSGHSEVVPVPIEGTAASLRVEPPALAFDAHEQGPAAVRLLRVFLPRTGAAASVVATAVGSHVGCSWVSTPSPGSPGVLEVSLSPGPRAGPLDARIVLRPVAADDSRGALVSVPVTARHPQPLELAEPRICLGVATAGERRDPLWITAIAQAPGEPPPLRVTGGIDVRASWWRVDGSALLRIDWSPRGTPGRALGALVIGTGPARLEVPLSGFVLARGERL